MRTNWLLVPMFINIDEWYVYFHVLKKLQNSYNYHYLSIIERLYIFFFLWEDYFIRLLRKLSLRYWITSIRIEENISELDSKEIEKDDMWSSSIIADRTDIRWIVSIFCFSLTEIFIAFLNWMANIYLRDASRRFY